MFRNRELAFSLSELLIALMILGEIATFTIPKIIYSQRNNRFNAVVKETASAIAAQYQTMKMQGLVSSSTSAYDILTQMNALSFSTSSGVLIDSVQGNGSISCSAGCAFFASGAGVRSGLYSFNGTSSTNAIGFTVDPDGRVTDGTTNGPGKSVQFYMTYNGKLTTGDSAEASTYYYNGSYVTATSGGDPPYFSW
jgi:type II secretory pathway pseudopilin PulG